MQTFMPYPDFQSSASALDWRRLGKQRLEVLELLTTDNPSRLNHPARKMWAGYEWQLAEYGLIICREWKHRGYHDSLYLRIEMQQMLARECPLPPWFGGEIHANHRARLLQKDPEHYTQFGWSELPCLDNYWPL